MTRTDPLVVFTPSGKRGRFAVGTPLLTAARQLGVDIDSVCGGRAICGRCQVLVAEGEFAKHGVRSSAASLSPVSETEMRYGTRKVLAEGRRLSCQAKVEADVVVDVPSNSQVHRQVVRKEAEARDIELYPLVKLHYVEVAEPDMHDPSGDLQRLELALAREWQLKDLECDLSVLQQLQPVLRAGQWQVTVAVHDTSRIVAVWPGFHEKAFGLAVDVGSTTIAAHLCDLISGEVVASAGRMNPQIRFGEDLMSRVSYSMMNPGGAAQMTAAVREALSELAAEVAAAVGIEKESILEVTLVGNPIMHHLVLGIDPVELGGAPFALAIDRAVTVTAAELGIALHPNARVYALPCIAGHVGADTAGVILAERPDLTDEMTLLVDVGTNAEIVLGNSRRLVACSSPTGPAFEGAQISCGQRAAPGAIERVRIDRATLEPRFKVIGSDLWSDDPRLRGRGQDHGRHRRLRLGHHRGDRRDVSRRHHHPGRRHRRRTGGPLTAGRGERAHLLLRAARRRPDALHHAERRARDPARQGSADGRHSPADGTARRRDTSTASGWPVHSARTSTSCTRPCSA